MISNEERREVAERLRNDLRYMRKSKMFEDDLDALGCGNRAYRNIAASVEQYGNDTKSNYVHIVERLADLIEPTTCTVRMGVTGHIGVCMRCGAMVEMSTAVFDAIEALPTRYCPNCGARVTGGTRIKEVVE